MRVLFVVLLLSLTLHGGLACMCISGHIQDSMCQINPPVVFKGFVNSVDAGASTVTGHRGNEITVSQIFQDDQTLLTMGEAVTVFTPTDEGLCIFSFTPGETYLVEGRSDSDGLKVNGCTETDVWPADSEKSSALTYTLQNIDCGCKVRVCVRSGSASDYYQSCLDQAVNEDECVHDEYGEHSETDDCGTDYSLCRRQNAGSQCSWQPSLPTACPASSAIRLIPSIIISLVSLLIHY